jgi:hypothetical protein
MATADEKAQALAAIQDFAELGPKIKVGLSALTRYGNEYLKAFPAPQHPHPEWRPGVDQLPPVELQQRLDAILAGLAVAGQIVADAEAS